MKIKVYKGGGIESLKSSDVIPKMVREEINK